MLEKIIEVVTEEFGLKPGAISESDNLRDLGDSMELSYLALALEDLLGVTVEQNQVLQVKTVGDLSRLAERLVAAR